ncbi:MAG: hypothetical protein WKF71_01115 [Pyrinomonadaceae bacterium]
MPAKDRAGHDISIAVKLDAGVTIENVTSKSHEIESVMLSANSYNVKLKNEKTIPNKDFILRYDVSGKANRRRGFDASRRERRIFYVDFAAARRS